MVSIFCGGGVLIGPTFVGFNSSVEKSVKKVEYPTFRDGCSILGELARATDCLLLCLLNLSVVELESGKFTE
jgi:hypothetical protein